MLVLLSTSLLGAFRLFPKNLPSSTASREQSGDGLVHGHRPPVCKPDFSGVLLSDHYVSGRPPARHHQDRADLPADRSEITPSGRH